MLPTSTWLLCDVNNISKRIYKLWEVRNVGFFAIGELVSSMSHNNVANDYR